MLYAKTKWLRSCTIELLLCCGYPWHYRTMMVEGGNTDGETQQAPFTDVQMGFLESLLQRAVQQAGSSTSVQQLPGVTDSSTASGPQVSKMDRYRGRPLSHGRAWTKDRGQATPGTGNRVQRHGSRQRAVAGHHGGVQGGPARGKCQEIPMPPLLEEVTQVSAWWTFFI